MKLVDYIKKCVDDYVKNSTGENHNLRVFVDCTKQIGDSFVQINGIVYIPNSKDAPFNGLCVRTSDLVDGWEEFDESGVEIPSVKEILVIRRKE